MEFQDKVLKCIDCGADFVFTAGEQLFFHDKAFRNEPKRCKACKAKRVAVLGAVPSGNHRGGFGKVETRTTCSQCPARPTSGTLRMGGLARFPPAFPIESGSTHTLFSSVARQVFCIFVRH